MFPASYLRAGNWKIQSLLKKGKMLLLFYFSGKALCEILMVIYNLLATLLNFNCFLYMFSFTLNDILDVKDLNSIYRRNHLEKAVY